MNNDLKQFSEERLIEITELKALSFAPTHKEIAALARIALAAKQAKPIGAMCKDGSKICFYENREVSVQKVMHWVTGWPFEIYTTPIYITPQPAHAEQGIPDGFTEIQLIKAITWINRVRRENQNMKEARTCAELILRFLPSAPKPESE